MPHIPIGQSNISIVHTPFSLLFPIFLLVACLHEGIPWRKKSASRQRMLAPCVSSRHFVSPLPLFFAMSKIASRSTLLFGLASPPVFVFVSWEGSSSPLLPPRLLSCPHFSSFFRWGFFTSRLHPVPVFPRKLGESVLHVSFYRLIEGKTRVGEPILLHFDFILDALYFLLIRKYGIGKDTEYKR